VGGTAPEAHARGRGALVRAQFRVDLDGMRAADDDRGPQRRELVGDRVGALLHLERDEALERGEEAVGLDPLDDGDQQPVGRHLLEIRRGSELDFRSRLFHGSASCVPCFFFSQRYLHRRRFRHLYKI
jgi:hypothetical protein